MSITVNWQLGISSIYKSKISTNNVIKFLFLLCISTMVLYFTVNWRSRKKRKKKDIKARSYFQTVNDIPSEITLPSNHEAFTALCVAFL